MLKIGTHIRIIAVLLAAPVPAAIAHTPTEKRIDAAATMFKAKFGDDFDCALVENNIVECIAENKEGLPAGRDVNGKVVSTIWGESYVGGLIVLAKNAPAATPEHERRHLVQVAQRKGVVLKNELDHIVYSSFAEADAFLNEAVNAAKAYYRTGDMKEWESVTNLEMRNVFQDTIKEDSDAIQALENGRDPRPEVLRKVMMSYFTSLTAQDYLLGIYYPDYGHYKIGADNCRASREALQQKLMKQKLSLSAKVIANNFKRDGVAYLKPTDGFSPITQVVLGYVIGQPTKVLEALPSGPIVKPERQRREVVPAVIIAALR